MTRIIGFCGRSGSGKTTLIVRLIERLRERGDSVAVIKHTHHAAGNPRRGDTEACLKAGAGTAVLVCADTTLVITRESVARTAEPLETIVSKLEEDFLIAEGFRLTGSWPRLLFVTPDEEPAEGFAALVRADGAAVGAGEFHRDDVQGILAFVDRIAAVR